MSYFLWFYMNLRYTMNELITYSEKCFYFTERRAKIYRKTFATWSKSTLLLCLMNNQTKITITIFQIMGLENNLSNTQDKIVEMKKLMDKVSVGFLHKPILISKTFGFIWFLVWKSDGNRLRDCSLWRETSNTCAESIRFD